FQGTTKLDCCCAIWMRTIAPLLNARKSRSIPSEKMTPPSGMADCTTSSWDGSRTPATKLICECLLLKGSRTTQMSLRSSHFIVKPGGAFDPKKLATPDAMLNTEESQPVEPAPVETMIPLDD